LGYTDSLTMGRYNPEVRHGSLPAGYRSYVLRYPSSARERLAEVDRATLLSYCQPVNDLPQMLPPRLIGLPGATWATPGSLLAADAARPATGNAAPRYRRVYYTVRRGQTIATVAEKFDVSPAQVRRWNELPKQATVKPGRELLVMVPMPPAAAPAATVAVAMPPIPRHAVPADSAMQALANANARYAREAQASALREADRAKELLRAQRLQAARVAAQQQRAIFQAAALAKTAAREERAAQLLAASSTAVADEAIAGPDTAHVAEPVPRRRDKALPTNALAFQDNAPVTLATKPMAAGPKGEVYTVRFGDNLSTLAHSHGATIAQVQEWNHLTSETLVAGQRLRFGAPNPDAVVVAARATQRAERAALHFNTHTVQSGDTLYNISQRFKVSVQELQRLNNLPSDKVKLKLGQKLVVQAS
ncbi:MAG: LysM peptidoglycan-binding domain-containing protein, partial [Hymenobacter sp.]